MDSRVVAVDELPWESPGPGLRFKAVDRNGCRMRIAEFSEGYVERDWCTRGHLAYVLAGKAVLDFNGQPVKLQAGDSLHIQAGEKDKHKLVLAKGQKIRMILFEAPEGG